MSRTLSLCLVMLVGAGCSEGFKDGTESPDDTGRPGSLAYDDDGDGYSEDQGDCDDSDPLISPDEAEVPYNGIDDDCDDSTRDLDADGDGHDADFAQGGDDCDGLDLLTFVLLRRLGFEESEIYRSIVVERRTGQHHMVTLWFDTESRENPYVLDPTGVVTDRMVRLSEVPSWDPIELFDERVHYRVELAVASGAVSGN